MIVQAAKLWRSLEQKTTLGLEVIIRGFFQGVLREGGVKLLRSKIGQVSILIDRICLFP